MDLQNGLWLLPSLNRVNTYLPRFFEEALKMGMVTPGVVLVDEADYAANAYAYDALELPPNWTIHVTGSATSMGGKIRVAYSELCDGLDWIGIVCDDLIPETMNWDQLMIAGLDGSNIISTNDHKTAPKRLTGAVAWSGDLVRAVGYLYRKGSEHLFFDDVWEEIGNQMRCWQTRMDISVRHGGAEWSESGADATTHKKNSYWVHDETAFFVWKNKERAHTVERVGQFLKSVGKMADLPDLKHIKLLISTPSGDGRYQDLFKKGLFGTIALLRQCGAQVNFSQVNFCSDISLARCKLLGQFLRSDATHQLCIDEDMGWEPYDILRMLNHDREFVAVAGPRKVYPASFAVQNVDAQGRPAPIQQEAVSGLIKVSDIGLAFALLKRSCVERVVQAYPELAFVGDDGREEYAVFNSMVVHKRYKSEDYSFCERWRAVGGQIYVDPFIPLAHVGTHVWKGDWMSWIVERANEQRQAA